MREALNWGTVSDPRPSWETVSSKTFATELALRGGSTTISGSQRTIGPSIELQNAPDGMTIQSLERTSNTQAKVTLRMTADALAAFNLQQRFNIKIGGMLFDNCKRATFSIRGAHLVPYDLTDISPCFRYIVPLQLAPGKKIVLTETDGSTIVGDSPAATDTYTIRLSQPPTATLTVTPTISDTSAKASVSGPVVFNPSDRGAALTKTITVTGDDDSKDNKGGLTWPDVTITHTIQTTDTVYNSATLPDVVVDLVDDEPTIVSLKLEKDAPDYLIEAALDGSTIEVTLADNRTLGGTEKLTIPLELVSDTGVVFAPNDQAHVQLEAAAGVWNPKNFKAQSAKPSFSLTKDDTESQTAFTVKPFANRQDDDTTADIFTVRIATDANGELRGNNFEGGVFVDTTAAEQSFVLFEAQGDTPNLAAFAYPTSLQLAEGETAELQVRIDSKPGAGANLSVTTAPASGTPTTAVRVVSGGSLTFVGDETKNNAWYKPQTVTIEALEDEDPYNTQFNLELKRGQTTTTVPVTIMDNDSPSGSLQSDKLLFGTSEFASSGDYGGWRWLSFPVDLKGDYVFAATRGRSREGDGFYEGSGSLCTRNGGVTSPCRRLAQNARGASRSTTLVSDLSGSQLRMVDDGLRVTGQSRGGKRAFVQIQLPQQSNRARLPSNKVYDVTLQIGGRLLVGEKDVFGNTIGNNSQELCAGTVSLTQSGNCSPVELSFQLYPDDLPTARNAQFVGDTTFEMQENFTPATDFTLGKVLALDFNGDTVTYKLKDGSTPGFSIGANDGVLIYKKNTPGLSREFQGFTNGQVPLVVIASSTGSNGQPTEVEQTHKSNPAQR